MMHPTHTPGPWRASPPTSTRFKRRICSACGAWEVEPALEDPDPVALAECRPPIVLEAFRARMGELGRWSAAIAHDQQITREGEPMKIKPCPFCGDLEAEPALMFGDASSPKDDPYQVCCHRCDARGPTGYGSEQAAIDRWSADAHDRDLSELSETPAQPVQHEPDPAADRADCDSSETCPAEYHSVGCPGIRKASASWFRSGGPASQTPTEQLATAREAFAAALQRLKVEVDAPTDDVGELLIRRQAMAEMLRAWANQSEEWVLDWFAHDPEGRAAGIEIGEVVYRAEVPAPTRKPRDPVKALRAVAEAVIGEPLLEAVYGDMETAKKVLGMIELLAQETFSTSALRQGACRQVLGEAFETFFESREPAKIAKHPSGKRLGVANQRFIQQALRRQRKVSDGD